MPRLHSSWLAPLLLLLTASVPAAAQVGATPPGVTRGLFGAGNATPGASDFTFAFDLTGGYDAIDVPATGAEGQLAPVQSGYIGEADATLRYQKGRGDSYMLVVGNGTAAQQQIASDLPSFRLYRGGGSVEAGTRLGRRSGLTGAATVSYEPTYAFGAFDTLARGAALDNPIDTPPLATADQAVSVTRQRWISGQVGAGAFHNWSSRQRMSVRYESFRIRPIDGEGLELNRSSAALYHVWNARQNVRLDASYRFDDIPQRTETTTRPVRTQMVEARARYERRVSPGRSIAFQAGGGAVEVRTTAFGADPGVRQMLPVVSGSITTDLTRDWRAGISGRRDITVLNGLSPAPFRSDEAMLSLEGTIGRRLALATTGAVSRGRGTVAGAGDFDLAMVNAQMRYALGARLGLVAHYAYNDHEFRNVSVTPTSFPLRFSRNSVRVGVTVWLPLYGTF